MSVYNFFPSTASTLANRLFSFSSSAAMRANLSCSCWTPHSNDPGAYATVDEVVRATRWQRHTVRGVFLVRQFEEILNIGPQFASKVASASFADSMWPIWGAVTTSATSTGSPLLISPSLTNTFGPSSSITCTSANSTTAALIFPVSVIIPSLHHLRRPRRAPRSRVVADVLSQFVPEQRDLLY